MERMDIDEAIKLYEGEILNETAESVLLRRLVKERRKQN